MIPGTTKGILNPRAGAQKFRLDRRLPSPDLVDFISWYWIIHWDLRGQEPYTQETLPYPCVHLVVERDNTRVWGVDRGKFARQLVGEGQVFGIRFRPGAFYPFVQTPASAFTDRSVPLCEALGADAGALEAAMLTLDDDGMTEVVERFLRERLPQRDPNVIFINDIVDCIVDDRAILRVDDLVAHFSLSKRTLQRLFSQYVGVTPKWVIQRYRLQEAAEQLAAGASDDHSLLALALSLGYYDQAHFIKDFKAVIGSTPTEYALKAKQAVSS
jgi:AraC-like DNA-binding protein